MELGMNRRAAVAVALFTFPFSLFTVAPAQAPVVDTALSGTLAWRNIGPFRGGRSVAVAGVPQKPHTLFRCDWRRCLKTETPGGLDQHSGALQDQFGDSSRAPSTRRHLRRDG
jgi:hypothetical protein